MHWIYFLYDMAAQAIRSGSIKNALVIGAETLSRFVDWQDRSTCILFGDGAGAFVLQASEKPGGVLSAVMHSDGSGGDLLSLPGGGSRFPATEATVREGKHYIHMDGSEVFRFATREWARLRKRLLSLRGCRQMMCNGSFRIKQTTASLKRQRVISNFRWTDL